MKTEKQMFDDGIELWRQEKYKKAILNRKQLLKRNPSYHEARFHLGHVYKDAEMYTDAISCFEQCLERKYKLYKSTLMISVCYEYLKQHDKALEFSLKSTEIEPEDYEAWLHLGAVYSSFKDWEKCLAAVQKSIDCSPYNGESYCNYGYYLMESGRREEALPYIQKAIELEKLEHAAINMGHLHLLDGNEAEAIGSYISSIEDTDSETFIKNFREDLWLVEVYPISRKQLRNARNKALMQYEDKYYRKDVSFRSLIRNLKRWFKLRKL